MNRNEKKMMIALAKSLVHQLDVNVRLIEMLRGTKAAEAQLHHEKIEAELDKFINLTAEEWKFDDEA